LDELNSIVSSVEKVNLVKQVAGRDLEKGKGNFKDLKVIKGLTKYVVKTCKILHEELIESEGILKIIKSFMNDGS